MVFAKLSFLGFLGYSTYLLIRKESIPVPRSPAYQRLAKQPYSIHPNNHFLTKVPESVGIIGSGVSGLCTAKELKQQGYSVEVLEKNSGLGGVWFKNYSGLGLQGPGTHYSLPDYPFPKSDNFFPSLAEVRAWLQQYAEDFSLTECISYNSEVVKISQETDGTWTVYLTNGSQKHYDFLVLASGRFHKPVLPELVNRDKFQGTVVHSSEVFEAESLFKGKRVVLVGAGRSSHELGRLASLHASNTSVVFRNADYSVTLTKDLYGLMRVCLLMSRITTECLPPWETTDRPFFHTYLKPVASLLFHLLSYLQRDLPDILKADSQIARSFPHRVVICDSQFVEAIKTGEVHAIKGVPTEFTETGLVVNGEELQADVVVFCTGFEQNWLGLDLPSNFLYRNILIPTVQNLAVIGYINTGGSPTILNLQAVWLAEVLRGAVALPSTQDMVQQCQARKELFEKHFDPSSILGHAWAVTDAIAKPLLQDMRVTTRRKERFIAQWLCGLNPSDYKFIITHRE